MTPPHLDLKTVDLCFLAGLYLRADKAALAERLQAFIAEWNQVAHPFQWSTRSVAKVMAKCKRTELPQEGSQAVAA